MLQPRLPNSVSSRLPLYPLIFCLMVGLIAVRVTWLIEEPIEFRMNRPPSLLPPGSRVLNEQAVLQTDQGNYLPVYSWDVESGDFVDFSRACDEYYLAHYEIAQVSEPTLQSNCHGWVFGGGLCLLSGEQVKQILIDHGYYPIAIPVPGDVIVYFDDLGRIPHSGIVSSVTPAGEILIESKFGLGSRYLHTPEAQPFATDFGFFRTDRSRHAVQLRTVKPYILPKP